MAKIVTLKDKDDVTLYPQTTADAVYDEDGNAIGETISRLDQEVSALDNELKNEPKQYEFSSIQQAGVQFTGGDLYESDALRVTDFIHVSEGDVVSFNGSDVSTGYAALAAYATSQNSGYIKEQSVQGRGEEEDITYVVPAGVNYIRFTQSANYLTDISYTILDSLQIYNDVDSLQKEVTVLSDKPVRYEFSSIFRGYINYTDGVVTANTTYELSDYVPVVEGDTIFFKGLIGSSTTAVLAAYNSGKTYQKSSSVQGTGNSVDYTYVVPEGIKYLRFTMHANYLDGIYYTIYNQPQFYNDIETLKEGKADCVRSVNLYDKDNGLDGYFLNSGGWTENAQYGLTNPIKVSNGVTYKTIRPDGMGATVRCAKCDESGNYLGPDYDMTESSGYLTITAAFDGYMCFNVGFLAGKDSFMVCKSAEYPNAYVPFGKFLSETRVNASDIIGNDNSNPLYGKILACDGDSICYGQGYTGGYASIIATRNYMTLQNLGISGGTLASNTYAGETPRHWISTNVSNLRSDADYIILEGGVNDAESMGTMSSTDFTGPFDSTTFNGAIDTLCQSLLARFPGKKIGYIAVHAVYNQWMPGGAKYEAVKVGFKKWGIPVLDLLEQCPPFALLPSNDPVRVNYTKDGDGWHPNENGYKKYYCDKIEAWMKML